MNRIIWASWSKPMVEQRVSDPSVGSSAINKKRACVARLVQFSPGPSEYHCSYLELRESVLMPQSLWLSRHRRKSYNMNHMLWNTTRWNCLGEHWYSFTSMWLFSIRAVWPRVKEAESPSLWCLGREPGTIKKDQRARIYSSPGGGESQPAAGFG